MRRQMPDGSYRWCGKGRARLTGALLARSDGAGTRKPMGFASLSTGASPSRSGNG